MLQHYLLYFFDFILKQRSVFNLIPISFKRAGKDKTCIPFYKTFDQKKLSFSQVFLTTLFYHFSASLSTSPNGVAKVYARIGFYKCFGDKNFIFEKSFKHQIISKTIIIWRT